MVKCVRKVCFHYMTWIKLAQKHKQLSLEHFQTLKTLVEDSMFSHKHNKARWVRCVSCFQWNIMWLPWLYLYMCLKVRLLSCITYYWMPGVWWSGVWCFERWVKIHVEAAHLGTKLDAQSTGRIAKPKTHLEHIGLKSEKFWILFIHLEIKDYTLCLIYPTIQFWFKNLGILTNELREVGLGAHFLFRHICLEHQQIGHDGCEG